jgi:hypothetical protein
LSFGRLYQVDRVCSSLISVPWLTLIIDSRDWFWLTFTSQSRQDIKAPLTLFVRNIIPAVQHRLPDDDKIALTSNELTTLQMVDRLFAVLDNSKDLALVKSFRSALADTNFREKLRDVDF